MLSSIPISTTSSPSVILELIHRIKVKDVMTSALKTGERSTPLREIQRIMRENRISGVPILEDYRLVGMISVDDIIRALDQGYIESPAELHMSKKLIVLEDDMPISFGITYFEKYKYGRFPVINKEKELVGIVTSRDITLGLLMELNKTIEDMEHQLQAQSRPLTEGQERKEFFVRQYDYEQAGRASTEIKKYLNDKGVDRKILRSIAVASYELEMNLVNHSVGGFMIFTIQPDRVIIEAVDKGPGIPDLEKAMTEGWSTANDWIRSLGFGAGMGLPNTRRVCDEFEINSEVPAGTHVKGTIYLNKEGL